jgi:hypothetical protein
MQLLLAGVATGDAEADPRRGREREPAHDGIGHPHVGELADVSGDLD